MSKRPKRSEELADLPLRIEPASDADPPTLRAKLVLTILLQVRASAEPGEREDRESS